MCTIVLILNQDGKSVALSTGVQKWQIKTAVIWCMFLGSKLWQRILKSSLWKYVEK